MSLDEKLQNMYICVNNRTEIFSLLHEKRAEIRSKTIPGLRVRTISLAIFLPREGENSRRYNTRGAQSLPGSTVLSVFRKWVRNSLGHYDVLP